MTAERLNRAAGALAHLVVGVPLGLLGLVALLGVGLGAALSLLWIGGPLLLVALRACREIADLDRRRANLHLDAHLPPLARYQPRSGSAWRQSREALADRDVRRFLTFEVLRLPGTLLLLAAALAPVALTGWLLVVGVIGIAGLGEERMIGPWSLGILTGLLLIVLAVPAAIVATAVLGALHGALRSLVTSLLAPRRATAGPIREMLAESIGDRTLSIAYWLPERGIYVDESGHPVALPEPGSGRAWTAVERHGERVAAIIHDAELEAGPELVSAAAAGAALALDNERLKADLRARLEELRLSRQRIVEAADAARRRIERDLHDGAQQLLVSVSLDLRMLQVQLRGTEHDGAADPILEKTLAALSDLRELARGIHPVVLSRRGLEPAVAALADRAQTPVQTRVEMDERPPGAVEAAAYFLVAEALTNVDRYAKATLAEIDISNGAGELVVVVRDDGVGGADLDRGTGLRGLMDRLAAVDGTLTVASPKGGGTRLEARIPLTPLEDEVPA